MIDIKKVLIIYLLLLVTSKAFAFGGQTTIFEVEEKTTTLREIAKKNHKIAIDRFPDFEDYYQQVKIWNEHVEDENEVHMGSEIYTDYPYSPATGYQWAPQLFWAKSPTQPKYSFFGFLTASAGTFKETLSSQNITVTSKQNSPITFGIGGNYPFDDQRIWSINSSVYFSYLTAQTTNRDEKVNIDPEIGGNVYLQYTFPNHADYSIYGGLDIEKFSTFNTDDLIAGAGLDSRTQLMSFATFGFNKLFMPGGKPLLFKLSYSLGVTSSSNDTGKEFKGDKYLFYLNYKLFSNILVHFLFKQHILSGPTELSISRYGAGIGWSFR